MEVFAIPFCKEIQSRICNELCIRAEQIISSSMAGSLVVGEYPRARSICWECWTYIALSILYISACWRVHIVPNIGEVKSNWITVLSECISYHSATVFTSTLIRFRIEEQDERHGHGALSEASIQVTGLDLL